MNEMKVINIFDMNIMQHLIFMHKFINNQLHINILDYFKSNKFERYYLRSNNSGNLYLPLKRSNFTGYSVSYRGPKLWNKFVDKEIQNPKYLFVFKRILRYKVFF